MVDSYAPIHVLAFAGSLREDSYNRALIDAAAEVAPDNMHIEFFDIEPIPAYNADLDNEDDRPEAVRRLKDEIAGADALLFATPEYNFGIPGVLKNTIDWASRPMGETPMAGKTAAVMGATTGMWGTVRAQEDLRDVLRAVNVYVVLKPEVLIASAREAFDDDLRLVDEAARGFLRQLLDNLAEETLRRRLGTEDAIAG